MDLDEQCCPREKNISYKRTTTFLEWSQLFMSLLRKNGFLSRRSSYVHLL